MSFPVPERAVRGSVPPEALWLVAALAGGLFAARLLAAGYGYFFENDSISLAAGVATLLRHSSDDIYRYGPQVGYYQLVAALTRLAGGSVMTIPLVQTSLAVVSGTVIPVLGLWAFRGDLSRLERWFLAATLAANPLLWMTSRYGSSAMASVPLAFGALVILSNRPAWKGEIAALGLLAAAIFVRADAVLVMPGVALLLWRNHGRLRPAVLRILALGLFVAAVYGILFAVDPRIRSVAGDVESHLATPAETMFWEYLLWSVSPIPLIFTVLGLRAMLPARPWLLAVLAGWSMPVLAFYFPATTQPRYFLLVIFPVAIAAAVGMASVVQLSGRYRRLALVGTVVLGSVHLLVGLGRFAPGHRRSFLTEATVPTHTGPLWTGALLYKSYWMPGLTNATILHPRFGDAGIERSLRNMFAYLASGAQRDHHILLLIPRFGNVLHFYAQAAGVRIVSMGDGPLWYRRIDMELGGARLTTLGLHQVEADSAAVLPVNAGDKVWLLAGDGEPVVPSLDAHLPADLVVVPDSTVAFERNITCFRLARAR